MAAILGASGSLWRAALRSPQAHSRWATSANGPRPLLLPWLREFAAVPTTKPGAASHIHESPAPPTAAMPAYLLADLWMF